MPPTTRRRWLAVAVGTALVVLVGAELTARAAAPYLPEPLLFGDEATAVKVAQMDARGPACTDVVLAGNSMGRDAFDPATFTAADRSHRRAYNASLDAASPELLRPWLLDQVVPRLHPRLVVLTLASLDVSPGGNATRGALDAYRQAPATGTDVAGRLDAAASRWSALVAERRALRDPGTVADAWRRWRDGAPLPRRSADGIAGVVGADGQGLSRRALHYQGDAGAKAFTRQQLLADWSLDQGQLDAEAGLIGDLRAQGIDVVLVVLPVTSDYAALHPHGAADLDAFVAAAQRVADQTGAAFVDAHGLFPDPPGDRSRFADTHHLNAAGAQVLSGQVLPDELAHRSLLDAARCG